jgi:hypothetical protein
VLTQPPSFPGLERVTATVDMVGWYWSYGLSKAEKHRFSELIGKRVVSYRTKHGGWLTRIATPHHHLDAVLEWTAERSIPINLVHIAFDLRIADPLEARRQARQHLALANAPNVKRHYYENGNFYLKDTARPRDIDGNPIGPRRGNPARTGLTYLKTADTLRLEVRFHGKANVAHFLPPLRRILSTDPRDIWLAHWRWKRYRPRLLAKKVRVQTLAAAPNKPLTGIWPRLLTSQSKHIARMTVVEPLKLDEVAFVWSLIPCPTRAYAIGYTLPHKRTKAQQLLLKTTPPPRAESTQPQHQTGTWAPAR